jgi:hypothetical protein
MNQPPGQERTEGTPIKLKPEKGSKQRAAGVLKRAAGVLKARARKTDVHSVEAFRVPYWLTISSDLALLQGCSIHACSGQWP